VRRSGHLQNIRVGNEKRWIFLPIAARASPMVWKKKPVGAGGQQRCCKKLIAGGERPFRSAVKYTCDLQKSREGANCCRRGDEKWAECRKKERNLQFSTKRRLEGALEIHVRKCPAIKSGRKKEEARHIPRKVVDMLPVDCPKCRDSI